MNIQTAHIECCKLIDAFEKGYTTFMAKNYDEASVRQSFINPFFETVLGWNVTPIEKNPNLIEVQVEKAQKQKKEEGTKRADYAFHTVKNGKRKVAFFVEAKKPSEELDEARHYLQAKSYARYEGLKISILTDFQQFHIVDCRAKFNPKLPKEGDHKKFVYTDFRDKEKFAIVYNLFNRDAIYNDSIDKYVTTLKKVKLDRVAKDPIDIIGDEFLSYIEQLRIYIAKALKYNDYSLTGEQLTEATQKIIDRLVFTRFLEDKNIEDELWVKKWAESKNPYSTFIKDCKGFADLYNGVVYNPHSLIDKIGFVKNEDWFAVVCKEMIDPFSEFKFNFNYIPIHILGSVYERFLGSVIRATPKDVKSEEKIEVRKAGGVYYTPKYIVDYIVENTIGKQINGKKPKEISKLHFADIACGSGSFLIGVYDCLLKYHTDYYNKNIKQAEGDGCIKLANDTYRLSIRQKRDILLNNIYGVDIDAQAVEVSQLSLFLKMLEDETQETLRLKGNVLFDKIKILPNLKDNIVCGNSLIGNDISDGLLFDFDTLKDLNVMDYIDAFPKIMGNGGFDAIVGNPPWVSLNGKFGNDILNTQAQEYLIVKYQGNTYMPNLYEYFIHRGLELINKTGLFSFIIPDRLGFNSQFISLRKKILTDFKIEELLYKAPFPNIVTDTLIFRFANKTTNDNYKIRVGEFAKEVQIKNSKEYLENDNYQFVYESNDSASKVLNKIFAIKKGKSIGEIIETTSGFGGKSTEITDERKNEKQIEVIRGRSIQKFSPIKPYFFDFKKENITGRTTDKSKLGAKEKVLLRKTGFPIIATYDESGIFPEQSLYFMFNNKTKNSLKYFTALINSKLFQFVYINKLVTNKDSTPQLKKIDLDKFPVYCFDFKNILDKEKHNKIVLLVTQLLQIKKQVAKTDKDKNFIESQCSNYENQIDKMVYELYDLTKAEIEIIEAASK